MAKRRPTASRSSRAKKSGSPKKVLTQAPTPLRVVIVGFGRLGGALALALKKARVPVAVLPRSGEAVRAAVSLRIPLADLETLGAADLCFLAVPDGAISDVAADVSESLSPRCALVHCAGAKDLSVLASAGDRPKGSFHPLCAVSSRTDSLAGSSVAIAATSPTTLRTLRGLVTRLGLRPITVDEAHRSAYHAGAVLSAGGLVALASAAVDALGTAGIPARDALTALLPLMRSALAGLERRGLPDALTGPVARGDAQVLAQHLAELPAEIAPLYRELMARSLELARTKLTSEQHDAVARAIGSTSK